MKKAIIIICLLLINSVSIFGQISNQIKRADNLYKTGNYQQAAILYDSIIKTDGMSAALLFNLGNTYVKLDKLGLAMVCYQKARAIAPSNKTISNNVLYVESKVQDRNRALQKDKNINVEPENLPLIKELEQKISSHTSSDTWGICALISFALLIAALILYFFTTNILTRKIGFFSALILLAITILLNVCAFVAKNYWTNTGKCVIITKEVALKETPDNDAKQVSSPLVEGTVLRIINDNQPHEDWQKVELNSYYSGYIPQSDIVML